MNVGTTFGLVGDAYNKFRPAYPKEMFERIMAQVSMDRRSVAMDLGAGTGLSTLPLCQWFDHVIAVEPDTRLASKILDLNEKIDVRISRAEECIQPPNSVDLVISVNAFYWMNGPLVIKKISSWLRSRGVVAICHYGFPEIQHVIKTLLNDELKSRWNKFRHPRLLDEEYSYRCVMASKELNNKMITVIPNLVYLDSKQLTGFLKSTSYVSAYLRSIKEPNAYLNQLESMMKETVGEELIPVHFDMKIVTARKKI